MEKLFEINEQYTYEDYLDLNKYYMTKSKRTIISNIILGILLIFLAIISFYLKNYSYLVFSISFAVIYPILLVFTIKRAAKKSYESNKIAKNMDQNITFYEEYFEIKNEVGNSKVHYDKLYSIGETKRAFFLFISFNQAFIVKKEALNNVQEFSKFIYSKK